ncbi:hypothetical protein MMC08_002614 [Hypocenomyce scalaris]|nr:hypothetical protein [Hypocenomyce scalaris]
MEQQIMTLLGETQLPAEGPRQHAERQLEQLYTNEAFPISLASIASENSVPLNLRQSALLVLKTFVLKGWSPTLDEFGGQVLINDVNKEHVRKQLLDIATSGLNDRKVKGAASFVISKIASADFPDAWPDLLPALVDLVPRVDNDRLHGVLTVLGDLVDDGFNEDQFFRSARSLVKCLFDVAVDGGRKLTLRALAVSVFRGCYDTLEMVAEVHQADVKEFMSEALTAWSPIFVEVLRLPLPPTPSQDDEERAGEVFETWRGFIALKIQVVRALEKTMAVFPTLLIAQSLQVFSATWAALAAHLAPYHTFYIYEDRQGRLEDADRLPYTLDFLILEELDLLRSLLGVRPVKKELMNYMEQAAPASPEREWIADVLRLLVGYSQITTEEEGLWEIDVNVFLSEESSETANYTPRNACSDLVDMISSWLPSQALKSLLAYVRTVFQDGDSSWRSKESALFILNRMLGEYHEQGKDVHAMMASAYSENVQPAMLSDEQFLRSRGFTVAGTIVKASTGQSNQVAEDLTQKSLKAIRDDSSDIVKVSCIRVLRDCIDAMSRPQAKDFQIPVVTVISEYLSSQDLDELADNEDLLNTMVETLRDAIQVDAILCLESAALDVLFTMASQGAKNMQTVDIVEEAFMSITESIAAQGMDPYSRLCAKVLPTLTGAFDVGDMTSENALVDMAATLLSVLAEHGTEPLPQGFVAAVMPKLRRLLFSDAEFSLHQMATTTIKHILAHDPVQMLSWHDPHDGKEGLEVILVIIDRLLGPTVDDTSAAEVGGLAAELVEKAGSERLGPYLLQLLRVVAVRLSTAEHAPFIQSLILVFARLSLDNAKEVLDFLEQVQIEGTEPQTGLDVVLRKWLENSINFSGYDEIRQNILALANIYNLHDERLSRVQVQGDLIMPKDNRIRTRSRAKAVPDQYTIIPASLKLIKVLVAELANASSPVRPNLDNGTSKVEEGSDDDEWEDEPETLDLGAPSTRAQLMSWMDESKWNVRETDDQTQAYLSEFFRHVANEPDFQTQYQSLNESEMAKLQALAQM